MVLRSGDLQLSTYDTVFRRRLLVAELVEVTTDDENSET